MIYEFKILPVNRSTNKLAFEAGEVKPQFQVDIAEFYRVMNAVNPTPCEAVLDEVDDRLAIVRSLAQAFSEMFLAEVHYREFEQQIGWDCFEPAAEEAKSDQKQESLEEAIQRSELEHPTMRHRIVIPLRERLLSWENDEDFREQLSKDLQDRADRYQVPVALVAEDKREYEPGDLLATFDPIPKG